MMQNIFNLCPHEMNFYDESGENCILTVPTTKVIRAEQKVTERKRLAGLPVTGVPEYSLSTEDEIYLSQLIIDSPSKPIIITSMVLAPLLKDALKASAYVVVPDMGPERGVRNEKGQIKGSKGLILY